APAAALDQPAGGERVERLADRPAADAQLLGQLALGREPVADAQLAAADARRKRVLDLGPDRNRRIAVQPATHWYRPVARQRRLRQKDRCEYLPGPCASKSSELTSSEARSTPSCWRYATCRAGSRASA